MNMKKFQDFFRRLSVRSLGLVLFSLGAFALVLALLLTFGLGRIMEIWHEDENMALHRYVHVTLEDLTGKAGEVTQADLVRAFEGLPFTPEYLVVTRADGSMLYYYREAERGAGRARMALKNLKDIQQWNEVLLPDGRVAFRFALYLPAFDELESNGFLIAASKLLLLLG